MKEIGRSLTGASSSWSLSSGGAEMKLLRAPSDMQPPLMTTALLAPIFTRLYHATRLRSAAEVGFAVHEDIANWLLRGTPRIYDKSDLQRPGDASHASFDRTSMEIHQASNETSHSCHMHISAQAKYAEFRRVALTCPQQTCLLSCVA